jgi:hypothetical protein
MVAQTIDVIESGMPGPPGGGVTPSQIASFAVKSSSNTFTAVQVVRKSSTSAFTVARDDGTDYLLVDTTNGRVIVNNGGDIRGFSDNQTTEVYLIDGATGNAQFDGTLTCLRVVGDTSLWSFVIDGGGSTITTGIKPGFGIPYACKITGWQIFGDQSGSIVVDLWKDTYANYPPLNADSMVTSQEPTISATTKGQNLSVNSGNGWTCVQGDYVRPNVDSVTTLTRVEIFLWVTRL